ncbi:MAG: hypothetical protein GW949_09100 [Spirochaetales bacterium]|nr:hypothetical protein [Spirochaetales bacterium]
MDVKKGAPIRGPLGITLNLEGVEYFRNNLVDVEKTRIVYPSVEARPLQSLAIRGYLEALDYKVGDISRERGNLIDLTKLMAYGMLYRQFEARVWDLLLGSDLVHRWNSEYPKFAILAGEHSRSVDLRNFVKIHKEKIRKVKQDLITLSIAEIDNDSRLQESERRKRRYMALKFLNVTDAFAWLILATFSEHPDSGVLLSEIFRSLVSFLQKSEVAENLSLLLVELVVVESGVSSFDTDVPGHVPVGIRMEFSHRTREMGERTQLWVYLQSEGNTEDLEDMKDLPRLDGLLDSPEYKGITNREILGYYYSYLKKACRTSNILLDTGVSPDFTSPNLGMYLSLIFQ